MKGFVVYICVFNLYLAFCNEMEFNFEDIINVKSYVYWPNATIPFYINPDHFDHEQSFAIMTALSMFAFKTCLKFVPVMVPPADDHHALVFVNPDGKRRCVMLTSGHSVFEPHTVILGYDCLKSPQIDMMIMRSLGFPFEHNKATRDLYVEVLMENIEPGAIELFTKESKLPLELRSLPYDPDSVMHFGIRDYSKNGHRTIIFKDHKTQQNRFTLTPIDLRKIEIVYGPECLKRDRQEKIELCQSYPGVARRKRSVEVEENKSLRVNPEITPPPDLNTTEIDEVLKELGIENDVQEIVDQVYKVTSLALSNARAKYCNNTKPDLRIGDIKLNRSSDILGIVEVVADYAKTMVDNALGNLTDFCESSKSIDAYQRARCPFYDESRCRQNYYKSTKSGPVRHSTQHRPVHWQSTKHESRGLRPQLHLRSDNDTDIRVKERKRRHVEDSDEVYSTRGLGRRAINKREAVNDGIDNAKVTDNANGTVIITDNIKMDLRMGTTVLGYKKDVYGGDRRDIDGRRYRFKKRKTTPEPEIEEDISEEVTEKVKTKPKNKIQVEIGKLKQKQERLVNKARFRPRPGRYHPKTIPLSKANKEFYDERKWPEGVVRYIISEENTKKYDLEDLRNRLEEVNSILRRKTCVKLLEISEDDAKKYKDYLVIDTSPDYVTGRVGGRQNFGSIELFRGGQHRQHAAMMAMAMLGFYFEVARHDRDKHIRVHMRHVRAGPRWFSNEVLRTKRGTSLRSRHFENQQRLRH
ncbi:uncharacterized protein LOC115452598 isoform X2 [Manduca sexta]|uniref:uncharacterized protein LOC115452598 isoform X2 n=1 Tax=Manduca sexta TaxID=7130 RepID=UPI00188EA8E6|nr:uncharacterized protein LOC115452598 isoform X2 [Manduca sexta]